MVWMVSLYGYTKALSNLIGQKILLWFKKKIRVGSKSENLDMVKGRL